MFSPPTCLRRRAGNPAAPIAGCQNRSGNMAHNLSAIVEDGKEAVETGEETLSSE